MKHIIIGTAGHIDHGKTALIRALTGRDTDRLEEEKRRGITIDLGFTYFDLDTGERAGIIDVPGHEKFIHNMAAGAAGMDLVLMVIAADEGMMPQTREHMDILGLLGVENYIIVLNKCDLADEEWLAMVEDEIRREVKGTPLEKSPLVRVSAVTGEGIMTLKEEIGKMSRNTRERSVHGAVRLPVDRVFSVAGFGTVATGTLLEGRIQKGEELWVRPGKESCRVRGIQVYNDEMKECFAGQRVALNLSGIEKTKIRRGCVLTDEKEWSSGRFVNVRLAVLAHSSRTIENQMRLHFHSGTSEILCRAVPLDREAVRAGESGYVQLRMESDTALRRGDRFVVRFYSPVETIGGGVILEAGAQKEKRFRPGVIERLGRLEKADPKMLAELQIKNHAASMVPLDSLAAELGMSEEETASYADILCREGKIRCFDVKGIPHYWHREDEEETRKQILGILCGYLREHPYRQGCPLAEVRSQVLKAMKKAAGDQYFVWLTEEKVLRRDNEMLAPYSYKPLQDERYKKIQEQIADGAKRERDHLVEFQELDFGEVPEHTAREIYLLLKNEGSITELVPDICTLPQYAREAEDKIKDILTSEGRITISQVRDLFGTGRKSAKIILAYTDRIGLTKKEKAESERVSG